MKRLERSIEGAVVAYAKQRGIQAIKLNGMGKRALPDRMFLGRGRKVMFVEFKREGLKPTPLQAALHASWLKLGFRVQLVDNVADGKKLIDWMVGRRIDMDHPLEDR